MLETQDLTNKTKKATYYGYGNHICRREKSQCQL